jgi:hypothetical protein
MAKEKSHHTSGILIPACLFIGLGIGLALSEPGVGVLIGLGVGFFAMVLIKIKSEPVEITLPSSIAGYFIILLGIALIVIGLGIVFFPEQLYPYIVGLFVALFGIGFLILGSRVVSKKNKTRTI